MLFRSARRGYLHTRLPYMKISPPRGALRRLARPCGATSATQGAARRGYLHIREPCLKLGLVPTGAPPAQHWQGMRRALPACFRTCCRSFFPRTLPARASKTEAPLFARSAKRKNLGKKGNSCPLTSAELVRPARKAEDTRATRARGRCRN